MNTAEQNNILIAEFLGMQKTDLGWFDNEEILANVEKDNTFDLLKFDSDWNWLIELLKHIGNKTQFTLIMGESYSYFNSYGDNPLDEFGGYDDIKNIFTACVEFINWHNENLTSQI